MCIAEMSEPSRLFKEVALLKTTRVEDLLPLLADARARTLAYSSDLSDEQFNVPLLDIINPFLWELGHIAYFAEFWILRNLYGRPAIITRADQLYDSAKIPHDDRWTLVLPSRAETLAFMEQELGAVAQAVRGVEPAPTNAQYFHNLALYHEDMHGEAFVYTRQTLGYGRPAFSGSRLAQIGPLPGDVRVPAGVYKIGAQPDDGFVFDNEKWAHEVSLDAFEIARAPVTNAEYVDFVADGGYGRRELWSEEGWSWRQAIALSHPTYWRTRSDRGAAWERRHFDSWNVLAPHEPVCHVSWHETQAFCAWAGRRLPTETEWEVTATGGQRRRYPWGDEPSPLERANVDASAGNVIDVAAHPEGDSPFGCRQMIGNVWEWTSTPFGPYPGFSPDPYKEYSEPWFGTHMVLRGGAWSTRARLITARWRNFYRPTRTDIITGFRTCKAS
jgi:gamma-glutamyl hercynylcysteine S-oxide synthase